LRRRQHWRASEFVCKRAGLPEREMLMRAVADGSL
jgi:hypothetical protein